MQKKNSVFIATSLDGYIADKNGGIDFLDSNPEINTIDTGYESFTSNIDAFVFGRTTFETVCNFDIEWPYQKPVFVISKTLTEIPNKCIDKKVKLLNASLTSILNEIHRQGFFRLYIDGGKLIQSFLAEDLIDEMIITVIPILLGSGSPLFGSLDSILKFDCVKTTLYLDSIVQNHFVRKR